MTADAKHTRTHTFLNMVRSVTNMFLSHTHTHTHAYTHTRARYGVMMKLHQHSPTPTFPHTVTLYSSSGTPMVETESRYFRDNHTLHILKIKNKATSLLHFHTRLKSWAVTGCRQRLALCTDLASVVFFLQGETVDTEGQLQPKRVTARHWAVEQ